MYKFRVYLHNSLILRYLSYLLGHLCRLKIIIAISTEFVKLESVHKLLNLSDSKVPLFGKEGLGEIF